MGATSGNRYVKDRNMMDVHFPDHSMQQTHKTFNQIRNNLKIHIIEVNSLAESVS